VMRPKKASGKFWMGHGSLCDGSQPGVAAGQHI
jgi:hypothetical protein